MYTKVVTVEMKEKISADPEGRLQFGMGIDCPNIHEVIHWSPPCSLEMYAQESD